MIFLWITLALLGVYLVFCFFPAVVMFRSVFFHRTDISPEKSYYAPYAPRLTEAKAKLEALPATEVSLTARDGLTLRADYIDRGSDKTALLFHGYRALPMTNCADQAALLADQGYNLFLVHQRAHGKSDGTFCTLGYAEQYDVLDWISLAAADPKVHHLVLYGVSMGASAIAYASDKITDPKVRAMVLDCGFTGIYAQLANDNRKLHLPSWAVLPLLRLFYRQRFGFDIKITSAAALGATRIPALFVHGTEDESVPFAHGKANYAACGAPKEALFIPHALHTCAMMQGGAAAQQSFLQFLDRYVH